MLYFSNQTVASLTPAEEEHSSLATTTDYRTTVRVNAPADVVFDAVTTVEALAAWWSPVTGSGLTGGELRFPMVAASCRF